MTLSMIDDGSKNAPEGASSSSSSSGGSSTEWICLARAERVLSLKRYLRKISATRQDDTRAPLMGQFRDERLVLIVNGSQDRASTSGAFLKHFTKFDQLWNHWSVSAILSRVNDRPCSVSECFSNESGFCLKMTLPFFNSTRAAFANASGEIDKLSARCSRKVVSKEWYLSHQLTMLHIISEKLCMKR